MSGHRAIFLMSILCAAGQVLAGDVSVAVASNFSAPMKQLIGQFEMRTGHKVSVAYGGTGQLYAQIRHGAPFDVFLSADQTTPERLMAEGMAVAGSQRTYAVGRLVLWSSGQNVVDSQGKVLRDGDFKHLAIANPKLAPYGRAAIETLQSLGLWQALEKKLVEGKNISQAYQFVVTGNATLGFVAMSQVFAHGRIARGSGWVVPQRLYAPIRQDLVLLRGAKLNKAANDLIQFIRSPAAEDVIRRFGYQTVESMQ